MAQRMKWTDSAKQSRKKILEYWYRRNGNKKYSLKLSIEFNQRINHLKEFPLIGIKTNVDNVRKIFCGHYSIFYFPSNEIIILGVYDSRRDPNEIFLELLDSQRSLEDSK